MTSLLLFIHLSHLLSQKNDRQRWDLILFNLSFLIHSQELMKQLKKKSAGFTELDTAMMVLRICGRCVFIPNKSILSDLVYIRNCIDRRKPILIVCEKKSSSPALNPTIDDLQRFSSLRRKKRLIPSTYTTNALNLSLLRKPFSFQVDSITKVVLTPAIKKLFTKDKNYFGYVAAGLYHRNEYLVFYSNLLWDGEQLGREMQTRPVLLYEARTKCVCTELQWKEVLYSEILMNELPLETRLCITFFATDSKRFRFLLFLLSCFERSTSSHVPVGSVSFPLFNWHRLFPSSFLEFHLWPDRHSNPIEICSENFKYRVKGVMKLRVCFDNYDLPVSFVPPKPIPANTKGREIPQPSDLNRLEGKREIGTFYLDIILYYSDDIQRYTLASKWAAKEIYLAVSLLSSIHCTIFATSHPFFLI